MRKSIAFFGLAVLMFFAVGGIAMGFGMDGASTPKPKKPITLKGTTWTGQTSYVDTTGAVSTSDVVVTFDTQDTYYLSGTLTYSGDGGNTFNFSAMENPMEPTEIEFTAPDRIMEGDVSTFNKKRYLGLHGHNVATGGSFMGVLEIKK